jgi:hypothetical protein
LNKIKIFLLFVFINLGPFAWAQGGYFVAKGKILDKSNGALLFDAYICIPGSGYGTSPNLDGNFLFQFPNLSVDSSVVVSMIGYKSAYFNASDLKVDSNLIYLEPEPLYDANYGLSDVRIMLKTAIDSLKINYPSVPYYQNGFYQELVRLPRIGLIKLNEGILRIERFPNQKEKLEKVKLLRGRRMEWKGQTSKLDGWGFQNGTALLCRAIETQVPDFLQKNTMKKYDYRLDSLMTSFEGVPLFIIHFWPKKKNVKGAKEGTIYLEPESKAVVRIEYKLTEKGIKDLVNSNKGVVKITGKEVKLMFQYRMYNKKWHMQESKAFFDVKFADNLDNKFTIDTKIEMRYVSFENIPLELSNIYPNEILTSTNNFYGLNTISSGYWNPYNYLIPTEEIEKLHSQLKK